MTSCARPYYKCLIGSLRVCSISLHLDIQRKLSVANLPDAETHFHAHEFMDATVQPKPIYISLNEIYNIHSMLVQHQSHLVCFPSLGSIYIKLDLRR